MKIWPFLITLISFSVIPFTIFSQVDLDSGLLAYYPFSGNANDASGNGNNPIFNNATLTADYYGNANSAYYFNGVDNYMEIPNKASLNANNTISICAWIKPMGFYYGKCHGNSVIMKGNSDFQPGNYMLRFDDALYTGTNCDGGIPDTVHQTYYGLGTGLSPVQDTPYAQKNVWRSAVYTYDGLHARLYIDCELILDSEQPGLTFTNGDNLLFGKLNNAQFPYWLNAVLDEVRIYDRALNADEVKAYSFACADKTPCSNWAKVTENVSGIQIGDLDIPGNQITVEATFNRTDPYFGSQLYAGDLVSKHEGPATANYLLRPNSAEITTTKGYFKTPDICDIELNKTYHVAMVYNGKILKFYRNGFLMSSIACSGNLFQNNYLTTIGTFAYNHNITNENLIGYINEVRIWNVAKSQSDIQQYMDQSLPNPASQTGLLAYYTFDDLKNKQGNSQWDGSIIGDAQINQTNPTCSSFIADSCGIISENKHVIASFTGPDTVCINTPVQFKNTSEGASNYQWSFCSPFKNDPVASTVNITNNVLNRPVFSDFGFDNGNYYAIITNHLSGHITRLNYGNSLLNSPTAEDLGDFGGIIPIQAEGVQVIYVNGHWYAIAVGGGNEFNNAEPRIVKLDFGNSLANLPVATNWGNIGELDLPIDFYIAKENGNYYGFTMNVYSNTITRFDFGSDFINPPIGINLGNIGSLDYPDGFTFINNKGNWIAFAVNTFSNAITRLDFGSSLTNTPTAVIIPNPGNLLSQPRDIAILSICDEWYGYVVNAGNDLVKLDFGSDINAVPTATSLGNTGNFNIPHSFSDFFSADSGIYNFVPNANGNSISLLRFQGCTDIPGSFKQDPDKIVYTSPGEYTVNLMVDVGLPTQTSYCRQIVVKDCTPPVIVAAKFTVPDTVCVNSPAQLTNTSENASNYQWSFCSSFKTDPEASKINIRNNVLDRPVFSDFGFENGNYYAIVTNHLSATITRLNFGNSLLNDPIAEDLGDFNGIIPAQTEGVQVLFVNGRWYAIIVGGGNEFNNSEPRIVKLDFGNSLTNTPVATNWGNLGALDQPIDFYIAKENDNYYGFTMNVHTNTITRFNFGSDFINPPTGTNLGNIGNLDYPDGFTFINNNGNWIAFAVNTFSNAITRLDFGSSLTNTPTAVIIPNPGNLLSQPRDIAILSICGEWYGYVVNAGNDLVKLDFGSDINAVPTATSLGNTGNFNIPHSFSDFFSADSGIYNFVPNANGNSISLLRFEGCAGIPGSFKKDPDPILYPNPGEYTINLMADVGMPTQTSYCKQIVVLNCDTVCTLNADFSFNQLNCDPKTISFHDSTLNADSTWWDFGNGQTAANVKDTTIQYTDFGTYTVQLFAKTNSGCLDTATYIVNVQLFKDSTIIGKDTSICAGSSIQLNAITGLDYCWSPAAGLSDPSIQNPVATPAFTTTYYLNILTDNSKPVIQDSITITVIPPPAVHAGKDVSVCLGDSVQLLASGASTYIWSSSPYLSDTTIADPIAKPTTTTNFAVKGFDSYGCTNVDTVRITVWSLPVIRLTNDTAVCIGGSVMLTATSPGNNTYNWTPSTGLSDPTIFNPVASPAVTTKYFAQVIDNNHCSARDSVMVDVLPIPVVSTIVDTNICLNNSVTLTTTVANASIFSWSPSSGLNNPAILSPQASPVISTLYTVIAGNGICSTKDSILISVLSLPDVRASNDTIVCGNAAAQLNATGAVSYTWAPVTGLSDPNIPDPMAAPGITTMYIVTGTGSNFCVNTDSVLVTTKPPAAFTLVPQATAICVGDSSMLTASGGDIYKWLPDQFITNTSGETTTVFPVASTTYQAIITNSDCKVTDTLTAAIAVNPLPDITITKSNDIDCINYQAQLTATGAASYIWSPSTNINNLYISNSVVNPRTDTWYSVTGKSGNGCSNTDSVLVKVLYDPASTRFDIPNAFTPNHDGLNDRFGVKYWGQADVFDMSIYNRWGQLIFHSNNISACWDGNYRGLPQQAGTYVYQISVSSNCTEGVVYKKGTFVLIR